MPKRTDISSILVIGAEHPVEPEQHGEERRDPHDPGGEPHQLRPIRPDGKGHQRPDHDEKEHQHHGLAPRPEGKAQVRQVARNTVHLCRVHPSHIVLPVVPASE